LRPVVVRDAAAMEALSLGRYDAMRTDQLAVQPRQSAVLPDLGTAQLPAVEPTRPRPVEPVKPLGGDR